MEIEINEEDYNWKKYTASIDDSTNKRFANYFIRITWWWGTKEEAKENLIEKCKELIEDLNNIIYK